MQDYIKTNRLSLNTFLFFAVILFIAYLPISSFLFFLKNDAFNGYFPPKFFMSESIHAGYLPLWNPYINFGFPQYGDMSGGYWSPVTWLIASTIGYNAYSFTIEALLYILLGGIGMFQLTGLWKLEKNIRIVAGLAFMCCGYHVGHLQHFNWLSGSAFLPWCLWAYLLMLRHPTLKTITGTVLLFYMLLSSAHPGISIGAFYFFAAIFIFYFFNNKKKESVKERIRKLVPLHFIFSIALLLVSAGMIIGYADILPHFIRGQKLSLVSSLSNGANIQTWISALLPLATVKNDLFFNTDISLRNSYFSLCLLLFFLVACAGKKNNWQKFLILLGLSFTLLSAGGIIKSIAGNFIPLVGYVRHNGEFRIFALIAFIIVAAIELDIYFKEKKKFTEAVKWIYAALQLILLSFICWSIYKTVRGNESIVYHFKNVGVQSDLSEKLKFLIDNINFYDTIWMQGIIQMILLWLIKFSLQRNNLNLLKKIVVIDLILASLFNIPFTGAGKTSLFKIQAVINKSPKGIPIPPLQAISNNDTLSIAERDLLGNWSMYNKQIGTLKEVSYPIQLKNMHEFFVENVTENGVNYFDKPFLFLKNGNIKSSVTIQSFSPNNLSVAILSDSTTQLIFQQNYYPHWFYKTAETKALISQEGTNFMSMPAGKGKSEVSISFEPVKIKRGMIFSTCIFLIYILLLIMAVFKRSFPS